MADVERLNGHWKKHPPLRHLVHAIAAALGIKFSEQDQDKPKPMTLEEFTRMVRSTGGKIEGVGRG